MGKKQTAQLTYFDYVTGITIGSMVNTELAKRGIHDLSQVTYICLGSDQQIYIDLKKDMNTKGFNISD